MTFIASVVAKDGVAIIADSLVTSSTPVLEYSKFAKFIKKISKKSDDLVTHEDLNKLLKDISGLFVEKPSNTKDFEDKLYKYDKWTAITTAGSAEIVGVKVKNLLQEAIETLKPESIIDIDQKAKALKYFLESKIQNFLKLKIIHRLTILVMTHYDVIKRTTTVYKFHINQADKSSLKKDGFEFITISKEPEEFSVICDGHNRMIERILFGDFYNIVEAVNKVISKIIIDFNIDEKALTDDYKTTLLYEIFSQEQLDDIKIDRFNDLSMQQAVDLACLMMRIVIDIQKYTEVIPMVGGVVKLAVIDNKGFRFIYGDEIVKHEKFLYN